MSDFHQIVIVGTVAQSAQTLCARNGTISVSFTVSVSESWFDDDGMPNSKTTSFTVLCRNRLASHATQLIAGNRVLVIGGLEGRAYTGRDSKTIVTLEIKARQLRILNRGVDDSQRKHAEHPNGRA
jgi:single-stranded DNA-binding protein